MIHSRHPTRIFLTPYLLGALLLIVLPAGISFYIAFTRYNGIAAPTFVGWWNFQSLSVEPLARIAAVNALIFISQSVPLRVLGALGLALLFNRPRPGTGFYRAAVALPTVVPEAAYALTWTWILNPLYGPFNALLRSIGFDPPAWFADANWAMPGLILASLFPIGEGFIILLAGLRHIPREVYDAARVDGANSWHTFRFIVLPLLAPWLALFAIRDVVMSFQNTFSLAFITTRGGPYYATYFPAQLIYEFAFNRMDFGAASAAMLMVFLLTIVLVLLVYSLFSEGGLD